MSTKGIDISAWQGNIDFDKVKASGIDFVIIRAGYGKLTSQKDKFFEQNYSLAKAAGFHVGVYWYSYALSVDDAKKEAKACLEVIKEKKFEYPIFFDLEEASQFANGVNCNGLVKAFCGALEDAGYFSGLYIGCLNLKHHISSDVANRYALWIAEYNSTCTYSGSYGMWQHSCKGKVNGIGGYVDLDYSYIKYPSVIIGGGFNGYGKSENFAKKSVDEIAKEVIAGKWGNGDKRKEELIAAGYDYLAVQRKVNELIR